MLTDALVKRSSVLPSVFNDFFKPWNEWLDIDQFNEGFMGNLLSMPAVNILENKDDFKISLAVPGMKKSDFDIKVEGNMLTISSERKEEKEEQDARYTRKEFNYSSFSRSFTLPEGVIADKIEARYDDGILKLTLPKTEERKKISGKHITVK